jgi:hypothetical protein
MPRITEAEARTLWREALRSRDWERRTIAAVMFDWPSPEEPTLYHESPPVWKTLADARNEADRETYLRQQERLLQHAERISQRRGGGGVVLPDYQPIEITRETIIDTLQGAVRTLHPAAARHEQVLRAKFVSQLPPEQAQAIATLTGAVHPERITPSDDYRRTGTRDMHARYDLGFGHPIEDSGIVGAIELKDADSFDQKLDADLEVDFGKLLDPRLPPAALRISWMVARRRGRTSPDSLIEKAEALLAPAETKRRLQGRRAEVDQASGWLGWRWGDSGVQILLAWYQPREDDPSKCELVWGELRERRVDVP